MATLCIWGFDLLALNRRFAISTAGDAQGQLPSLLIAADDHTLRFSESFEDAEMRWWSPTSLALRASSARYGAVRGRNQFRLDQGEDGNVAANRERYKLFEILAGVAALLFAVPLTPALAYDYDDGYGDSHSRLHRQLEEAHERGHEEGFSGPREHRVFHRALRYLHREYHQDDYPRGWACPWRARDCR
jgi:hypothetical protein